MSVLENACQLITLIQNDVGVDVSRSKEVQTRCKETGNSWPLYPLMACGHTDDVPNTFDPEVQQTPESSSVPPDIWPAHTHRM